MVGNAGLGIQPGMTSSQWTLGWDPGEQVETGGYFSRAEEKESASVESVWWWGGGGQGGEGDDHWAVVLKDSEPPATGVDLLSLQPAYLLQYHRRHVLPCDNRQPSLYCAPVRATDGLAFVRSKSRAVRNLPCSGQPVRKTAERRKGGKALGAGH